MTAKATSIMIAESVRAVLVAHGYTIVSREGVEVPLHDVAREAGNNAAQILAFADAEDATRILEQREITVIDEAVLP